MKVNEQLIIYNHGSLEKLVAISNKPSKTDARSIHITSFSDLVKAFSIFSYFGINWNRDGVFYEKRGFKSDFVFMDYDNLSKDGYDKIHKYYEEHKDICFVEDSSSCDVSKGKYKLHLFHWVDDCVIWKSAEDPRVWESSNPYKMVHRTIFGKDPVWEDKKNNPSYQSRSLDAYDMCIEKNLFNKCFNRIKDANFILVYNMKKYTKNKGKYTFYKYSNDVFNTIFKDFNISEKLMKIPCRKDLEIVIKEVSEKHNNEVYIPDYFTYDLGAKLKEMGISDDYYKKIANLRKYVVGNKRGKCFPNEIKKMLTKIRYYDIMPRMPMMRHCVCSNYNTPKGIVKKFFVDSGHRSRFCDHFIFCAVVSLYYIKKYDVETEWSYENIVNALMCEGSYIDIVDKDKFFAQYDIAEKIIHRYFDLILNEEAYINHIKTYQCRNLKYKPHLKNWNVEKPWSEKIIKLSNELKSSNKRINIPQLKEYWHNEGLDNECPFSQFINSVRSFVRSNIALDESFIIADIQKWLMIGKNCPHNIGMSYNTFSKKMDSSLDLVNAYNNGIISERTFKRRKKELGINNVLLRNLDSYKLLFVEKTGKYVTIKKEAVVLEKDKVRNQIKIVNVNKKLPKQCAKALDINNL